MAHLPCEKQLECIAVMMRQIFNFFGFELLRDLEVRTWVMLQT